MPDDEGPCASPQLVADHRVRPGQAKFTVQSRVSCILAAPRTVRVAVLWQMDQVAWRCHLLQGSTPASCRLVKHLASLHYYPCLAGQRSADVRMFQLPQQLHLIAVNIIFSISRGDLHP